MSFNVWHRLAVMGRGKMQTAEIDLPLTVVARGRSATRRRRSKRRVWPWIGGVSLLMLVQLWLIWGSGEEPARTARPVAASAIAPAEWIAAIGQLEPEGGVVEVAAARNAREAVVTALSVAAGAEVRMEVHEDEIARVRPEAGVTLQAAGITGPLTGQVVRIGQEVVRQGVFSDDPAAKTDARVLEVRVALDAASAARARELIQLQVLAWIETGPASAEATP